MRKNIQEIKLDSKLQNAINLLMEKLIQNGIDIKDKEVVIINNKLTIN